MEADRFFAWVWRKTTSDCVDSRCLKSHPSVLIPWIGKTHPRFVIRASFGDRCVSNWRRCVPERRSVDASRFSHGLGAMRFWFARIFWGLESNPSGLFQAGGKTHPRFFAQGFVWGQVCLKSVRRRRQNPVEADRFCSLLFWRNAISDCCNSWCEVVCWKSLARCAHVSLSGRHL